MPIINLAKGDKIQLPSVIEINGKTHKLISYDSPKTKQFIGIYCIFNDLSKIRNSIKNHIQNPSHEFEHFHALTILYRKCWNDSGFRYFKLEIERDLKEASKTLLDFHNFLIRVGNTYIAHPNKTDYDQCSLLLIMDDQKAIGVSPNRMTLENLSPRDYQVWLDLITYLQKNLIPLLEKMKNSVIDEYNFSMQNKNQPSQKS
ncbi:MAG: hypothetical protein WCT85_00465 [Parachlamydiales bacterium]|jgi:hypothetical protein